ncbi:MAG: hypothetical protein WC506_04340 [Candidatus Micrarchaeia archaeon]
MILEKKHMFLLLALAAFALIFSGCTGATPQPGDNASQNETVYWPPSAGNNTSSGQGGGVSASPCSDQPNVISKDSCLVKLASDTKNSTVCGYIYSNDQKDKCLSYFEDGTASYCGKYSGTDYKNLCLYNVAIASQTMSNCNQVDNATLRQECLDKLAPTCDSQPSEYLIMKCKAFKDVNPALCPDNSCIYSLALNQSNASICDSLNSSASEAIGLSCRSYATNSDSCAGISNKVVRDYCYELWAESSLDSAMCSQASTDFGYRQKCLLNISVMTMDYKPCLQNPSSLDADDCLVQYASITGDTAGCTSIDSYAQTARNKCYNLAAQAAKKASICNYIDVYTWRVTCYSGLIQAGQALDLNDCVLISDTAWNERCLTTLAYQKQNASICDFIRDTPAVQSCKSQLS